MTYNVSRFQNMAPSQTALNRNYNRVREDRQCWNKSCILDHHDRLFVTVSLDISDTSLHRVGRKSYKGDISMI